MVSPNNFDGVLDTPDSILALINDIFLRPILWINSEVYSTRKVKEAVWNELSQIHKMSVDYLKHKWKNLKRAFNKQLAKIQRTETNKYAIQPHSFTCSWPYYRSMLFLVDQDQVESESFSARKHEEIADIDNGKSTAAKKRRLDENAKINLSKDNDDIELTDAHNDSSNITNVFNSTRNALLIDSDTEGSQISTESSKCQHQTNARIQDATADPHLNFDSDFHFLLSLHNSISQLDPIRKLHFRSRICRVLGNELTRQD